MGAFKWVTPKPLVGHYVQASKFACHPQVALTDTSIAVWPPWRLLPNLEEFVSSLFAGYANRLNRAIDGRGLSPH